MLKWVQATCWGAILLASAPICAQETIFDPENPAVQGVEEEGEDEGDQSAEGEEGEETIFDPENPAVSEQPDDQQDVELAEPRLEPIEEGSIEEEPQGSANAQFLGAYATSLAVDTAWEGRDEDIVEWANELELRLEYDMPGQSRAVVEGEFLHWMVGRENPEETDYLVNASTPRASFQPRLGEAYVLFRDDALTIRFGNLVTPWGSTDIVRPGDVINPTDLSRVNAATTTSDLLLPQFTAEIAYSKSDWSLTGLIVPFFEPNDVVVFGRDVALVSPFNPILGDQLPVLRALEQVIDPSRWDDVQQLFAATRVPDESPENASAGARATLTKWNTDFGLGYFYGWDRTPWLEIDEEAFSSEHRRRHTLVVDVARYVGPIGVRADVALTPAQTLYSEGLEPLRRSTAFGALGLSWERFNNEDDLLAVTLEGFWLHPFDQNGAVNEAFVPEADRGPQDAELLLIGDDLYGAAAAFRWRVPLIDADLQLGAVGTLSTKDVVATASLGRRWYSWLQTTVGVTVFEGPDPAAEGEEGEKISLGGLYDHNDQVTLSVDGVF